MSLHTMGCMVCGEPLEYFEEARELSCEFCNDTFSSNAACKDKHYVCDTCHSVTARDTITKFALESESKNPQDIAVEMMKNRYVNMHGPEHHYMIPAALLTAYKNAGGDIDLEDALLKAEQRAKQVPGGICGLWGSCGIGVGAGIFISVATGATPLSGKSWSQANKINSLVLDELSKHGGPRCCKRNTFLSMPISVEFTKKELGIEMDVPEEMTCFFFNQNNECLKEKCKFYPKVQFV